MSLNEKLSDSVLIEMVKKGDVSAYGQLFRRYYPTLLSFIKSLLKNDEEAKDVAQNAFMKLWLFRDTLVSDKSVKNYLCVLAHNDIINIFKSKRVSSVDLHKELDETLQVGHPVDDFSDYMETSYRLSSRIEKMPPQRKRIFIMSRYENLSNDEIATRLNLSVRTVDKHIQLALKDLRGALN